MALAHCILGIFLGVSCHCFPPHLDVPTFSARCRYRPLAAGGGPFRGRKMFRKISSRIRLPRNSRDLLHAANLRRGTDGFTSLPKEGVLRIFIYLMLNDKLRVNSASCWFVLYGYITMRGRKNINNSDLTFNKLVLQGKIFCD
jgi:hypothetical protein